MTVFWVVTLCSLVKFTGVSEVLTASIMRAMESYEGNISKTLTHCKEKEFKLRVTYDK
jgi:hypothetical protein